MSPRSFLIALPIAVLLMGDAPPPASTAGTPAPPDLKIMQMQVMLDRLGFSPGVIDGKQGQTLTLALKGFQQANNLPVTGKPDPATVQALNSHGAVPPTRELTVAADDLAGPFVPNIPHGEDEQAKLPSLGYRNAVEALAEKFHSTPATLVALNSPDTVIKVGTKLNLPNVLPSSRDYPEKLPDDWKKTLSSLNVDANEPHAAKVVVTKSDSVLRVYDDDGKLVAQFPATMGSVHDPLPIGHWKIQGMSYNPKFHYNPQLFWDAKSGDTKAMLPAGPNGPVGVVWMDLNKPHYGIHGTPEPQFIGRTESHGCIRLANWDAARLSLMVKAGTPAIFEQ